MNITIIQDDARTKSIDQKSTYLKYYVEMLLIPHIIVKKIEPMEDTYDLLVNLYGLNPTSS
jgi:hypothetical protein